MLDTIIRDVKVLSDYAWQSVDIGIEAGRLSAVAACLTDEARNEFDGGGAFCFPGGVDLHVHFNEPGRTQWEGFKTGSAAAAAGGITTLAEMPLNSVPSTVTVAALETKLAAIQGKSSTDYALWGGVVPGNADHIRPLADAGVMGFKAFMSPSGNDAFDNADVATLREAMRRIAPTGLRLALHAEDPTVLSEAAGKLCSKATALDWEASRPVEAESSAVHIAIDLAHETGCPITVVHVSAPAVLDEIDAAKAAGLDIIAETCPHYLLLSINDAERIGTRAKCAPPLRAESTVLGLREAVLQGRIDTIGSDHSPSSPDLKEGLSFFDAWGGISGLQHGFPLLLDVFGIDQVENMLRMQTTFAQRPASLVGFNQKGALSVGSDADFVLVDAQAGSSVQEADLLYRHKLTAYVGMAQQCCLKSTWLRGTCIYAEGKIQSEPIGRFLKGSLSK